MPWPISHTTHVATSWGSLIGTPTPLILFAQSESDSDGWRPEMMSVRVMPGATTETEMPSVAVSFFKALIRPTIPVGQSAGENRHVICQQTMLRCRVQRGAGRGEIASQGCCHDNAASLLGSGTVLAHVMDGQLCRVLNQG
jgi:hypothetical protein